MLTYINTEISNDLSCLEHKNGNIDYLQNLILQ